MGLQGLNIHRKRYFALTGNTRLSLLAEVMKISTGTASLRVLAMVEGSLNHDVTLSRLLAATTEPLRGELSIALPLSFFETLTVTLPNMAEEAVGKALPYHLTKLIDKPLPEFIYDWQITRRQRDNLQITAYLYPAKEFQRLRKEFARKQLNITYLEADVFAAFAFLDRNGRLPGGEVTLCALIWPDSISLAVYENKVLTLVRSVDAEQPSTPRNRPPVPETTVVPEQMTAPALGTVLKLEMEKNAATEEAAGEDADSLLASFDVFGISPSNPEPAAERKNSSADRQTPAARSSLSTKTGWSEYVQNVNLEIMRTRDYYASVIKGGQVKNFVIGGAEQFWDDLKMLTDKSLEIKISPLVESSLAPNSPPSLNAVSLGTGSRW
jgi:hypothetical protein